MAWRIFFFPLLFLIFFGGGGFLSGALPVKAQTELTVAISVGETSLKLSGRASPHAQITFLEAGTVIGTTAADEAGNFVKVFGAQEPGIKNVGLYAVDALGRKTPTLNYSLALISFTQTSLTNIILPPTLSLSQEAVFEGETLAVSGLSVPLSEVTVFLEGGENAFSSITAGSSGQWQINFSTNGLPAGLYQLFARATTSEGYQSENSETFYLVINPLPATPTPTVIPTAPVGEATTVITPTLTPVAAKPTSTPAPTPTPTPVLPPSLKAFDLNNDERITSEEMPQALKKWVFLWREAPRQATCDLNADGICDLIDFSILLYYINR